MQNKDKFNLSEPFKVPIASLIDDPFALTVYNLGEIDLLAELLSQHGQLEPLIITAPIDGISRILSGRRRRLAAEKLGWLEINARIIKDITPNQEKEIVVSANHQRHKTFYEFLNEARFVIGTLGMQQGKERKFIGTDGDSDFGKVPKDRFELAAKFLKADMAGSTLRKLIYIDNFERENPNAGLGLINQISKQQLTIDRAFNIMKGYGGDRKGGGNKEKSNPNNLSNNENWTIYNKSCIAMEELSDGCVDCIDESLPYYLLRDYREKAERDAAIKAGDTSELGQEPTVEEFIENLKPYYKERFRVLNDKGSMFVNIGDTYNRDKNNLVSQRLALMLCDELGFHLVNEIVFHLNAKLPQAIGKRLQPSYEKVFHFVKSRNYKYYPFILDDVEKKVKLYKIDRPNKNGTIDKGNFCLSKPYRKFTDFITKQDQDDILQHCNVQGESAKAKKLCPKIKHPAPFSTSLMLLPILTTTKPGDLVLDGFGGSGSTLITAVLMGRKVVMYEKQERFVKLAKMRIAEAAKEYNAKAAELVENLATGKTVDVSHFAQSNSSTGKKVA